jgi:hypothetical protein
MPGTTTNFGIEFAEATDEVKAFPGEVSAPGAKKIDEVLHERFLTVKSTAVEVTAKAGELVETTATATVNLPAASTANLPVGVFCTVGTLSLKATHGEKIRGDFLEATECKFAVNQHGLLYPDGTNWLIMAGTPAREQTWISKTPSNAEYAAGITLSAAYSTLVMLSPFGTGAIAGDEVEIGGRVFTWGGLKTALVVPPGQKLKCVASGSSVELLSQLM